MTWLQPRPHWGGPCWWFRPGTDTVVGRDQTEALAEAGSATLHTVDGADHLFTDRRHSDELVRTILDWLSEVRAGA